MSCIFCSIVKKEVPAKVVFENEELIAFYDIAPKAKTHILIVPKKHIDTIKDLKETEQDEILVGKMLVAARDIAKERNLNGYKLTFNVGKEGGQVVFHIHLHLMSDQAS
jgi:histidine triad (HIT) family protein